MADDDSDTRVMLNKCQQNTFRMSSAKGDLLSAHDESTDRLSAWENRAHLLYDHHDEFEYSFWKYLNGMKRRRQPPTFTIGALKVGQQAPCDWKVGLVPDLGMAVFKRGFPDSTSYP